ncbi:MAG: 5-(carboxyamino)imidazole ribonucleotide mutase [Bacteroidaceae bacterium]|nr:5-(carboxyamino)imidazole ribonucleotide mutase [Bacteroidaceae bacterium]
MIGIVMGSTSDLEVMTPCWKTLEEFGVEYEKRVISAHRAPRLLSEWVGTAKERGIEIIIAGAGGAAHLAGVTAGQTTLPVIGIPIRSNTLDGLDSLLSTVQMPSGIPVATVAINGAKNAALLAIAMLALKDETLAAKLEDFRRKQTEKIENTVI